MIGVGRALPLPLPPNRTCGSPASGSPVGGFTSERRSEPNSMLWAKRTAHGRVAGRFQPASPRYEGHSHVFRPGRGVIAMHSQSGSRWLSRCRHSPWWASHSLSVSTSTFLRSLRSRPITALLRYYGRSDSCPALSPIGQVSLIHVTRPSRPSASNHLCTPRGRFRTLPFNSTGFPLTRVWVSPFTRRLTSCTGRIEFLVVRMSGSPPVAPHPALRRRSYRWFQAGERMPGKDFHPPDHVRFQSHEYGGLPPLWCRAACCAWAALLRQGSGGHGLKPSEALA